MLQQGRNQLLERNSCKADRAAASITQIQAQEDPQQLADYMEAMEDLKRRIKGAMTYPVVALAIIVLIAVGLIVWVVPQFEAIFSNFEAVLPAPTRLLIFISNVCRSWQMLLVIAGGIAMVMGVVAV